MGQFQKYYIKIKTVGAEKEAIALLSFQKYYIKIKTGVAVLAVFNAGDFKNMYSIRTFVLKA